MSIYGPPPHVEGLDKLRELVASRDIEVRQDYDPGVELEDGTWIQGGWQIRLVKRERMQDGREWLSAMEVSDQAVEWANPDAWELMVELLEAKSPTSNQDDAPAKEPK